MEPNDDCDPEDVQRRSEQRLLMSRRQFGSRRSPQVSAEWYPKDPRLQIIGLHNVCVVHRFATTVSVLLRST